MSGPRFSFTVMGEPKGQPRARAFARKVGLKYVARVFDAGTAEGWKSAIAISATEVGLKEAMLAGPVSLRMVCHFARPNSHFGTGKNADKIKAGAPYFHQKKPDLDNVVKAAKDALTQIGAWGDDCQVCSVRLIKMWSEGRKPSFTEFSISLMDEQGNYPLVIPATKEVAE